VRGVFGTVPEEGVPLSGGPTPLLAATTGYEIGLRTDIVPRLSLQLAAFQQDFKSELIYNADSGQDEASAPSRRKGIEVSGQYHPFRWLELNADLAFSRPRYHVDNLADYGLNGPYIADAPNFIYSAGILVDDLGPWSGGLQWRRLGTHSLSDGDKFPQDKGYSEFNLDVNYALPNGWKLGVGVFNIFDSNDDAADYYYTSRLPGEPAEGVTDFQIHPLEPRSARFTLTKTFGCRALPGEPLDGGKELNRRLAEPRRLQAGLGRMVKGVPSTPRGRLSISGSRPFFLHDAL
jgi:outer membrane receptor protein involved in Fe transport